MQIIGIGIDLQEIAPFEEHVQNNNARFFERIFSPEEIAYCQSKASPAQHFAARFCAKEAAVKAVSGLGDCLITHFEVVSTQAKPSLVIPDGKKDVPGFLAPVKFMVSISHTGQYAVAQVLAQIAPTA